MPIKDTSMLWDKAEELIALWPSNKAARLLEYLRSSVDLSKDATVDEKLFRAYLAYHLPPDQMPEVDIRQDFQYVLSLSPDNVTARLYLGHTLFDCGQYCEAKKNFELLDTNVFSSVGQKWRSLKIQELVLACRLHDRNSGVDANEIMAFAKTISSLPSDNIAIPLELINALIESHSIQHELLNEEQLGELISYLRIATDGSIPDKIDKLSRTYGY